MKRQNALRRTTMNYFLITIRSSQENAIFTTKADYQHCLRMISRLKDEYRFDIRGYCFMPDYFKLVVGLNPSDLDLASEIFYLDDQIPAWKKIVKIFPVRVLIKGQCIRIADRRRLVNVINYIEYEPVRAGIVDSVGQYRCSSAYC